MSEEYNPVAARLTVEEMKNIIDEEIVPIKGLDNGAKMFTTETLAKVNRVITVAALLSVEDKGESTPFFVAKLADPTGSIQINAGQYQPEAAANLAHFEEKIASTGMPVMVSIMGKLSTFTTDDGKTLTSIRADKVHEVDSVNQNHFLGEVKEHLAKRLQNPELSADVAEKYEKVMAKL